MDNKTIARTTKLQMLPNIDESEIFSVLVYFRHKKKPHGLWEVKKN